jgi:hypothetical protein
MPFRIFVPINRSRVCPLFSFLLTAFACLLPLAAHAQTFLPNWVEKSPTTKPVPRNGHAMTYDCGHSQVVLFGGYAVSGYLNDTWVWNGTAWTQQSPAASPPAREFAALAYDPMHSEIVLFGGSGASGILNDTWVWNGTTWTQMHPATSPPARFLHAMAYDSVHGQTVLFGGHSSTSTLNDTWTWDGSNWTQQTPANSPSARFAHSLSSQLHNQVYLFGGDTTGPVNDTWAWNGSNWTQQSPANSPPVRYQSTMVYDQQFEQAVVFGGYGTSVLSDTWLWNDNTWTEESPLDSPPARYRAAAAYDAARGQVVEFGGIASNGAYLNDTWVWGQGDFATQAVGTTSASQAFQFSIPSGGHVGSIAVTTLGVPNQDFAPASGSSCIKFATPGQICAVAVTFTPHFAGLRQGAIVFYSGANNTGTQLANVPIYGVGTAPQIAYGPGVATAISPTVNGKGLNASLEVAVDGAGDLYISDGENERVIEVPAGGGAATAIDPAVNGTSLNGPYGVVVDGAGDLLIGDLWNNRVVDIPSGGAAATNFAPNSTLDYAEALALDPAGNLLVVDGGDDAQVTVVPQTGGPSFNVDLNESGGGTYPTSPSYGGLAVDSNGNLFLADFWNYLVWEVPENGSAAEIIDPAGIPSNQHVGLPWGVATDAAGDLYISDHEYWRIVDLTATGGFINITPNVNGRGLDWAEGLTIDAAGDLFVADIGASAAYPPRIVEINRSQPPTVDFPTTTTIGTIDTTDGTQIIQILNIGNEPLTLTGLAYPTDFPEAAGDSNACTSTTTLSPGGECDLPIEFAPQAAGSLSENVTLTDNNLNGTTVSQSIPVKGTAVFPLLKLTVKLSASSLGFGSEKEGKSSAAKPITIKNTGSTSVDIDGIKVTGSDIKDYELANHCSKTLSAEHSCTVDITFKPQGKGSRSGKLAITDNAQNSPQTVSLSGTGD